MTSAFLALGAKSQALTYRRVGEGGEASMGPLKKQRVLLVDDDPSIRLSLFYDFRKKCRSFVCLETAEQALDHLRPEAYEIILCGFHQPGMDGLSFFSRRRVMTQSKSSNLDLNMMALVVADEATRRKTVDNYLKQKGHENTATPDNDNLPQAIFWLKKKGGGPEDRRK